MFVYKSHDYNATEYSISLENDIYFVDSSHKYSKHQLYDLEIINAMNELTSKYKKCSICLYDIYVFVVMNLYVMSVLII